MTGVMPLIIGAFPPADAPVWRTVATRSGEIRGYRHGIELAL
jgi:hypothetical protein